MAELVDAESAVATLNKEHIQVRILSWLQEIYGVVAQVEDLILPMVEQVPEKDRATWFESRLHHKRDQVGVLRKLS